MAMNTDANGRPEPAEMPEVGAAFMTGELRYESGFWRVVGKWALTWQDKVKSNFEWRSKVYSPNDMRPPSGAYAGYFDFRETKGRTRYHEKTLTLNFTKNTAGGFNINGRSETDFGVTNILGVVDTSLEVRVMKLVPPELLNTPIPSVSVVVKPVKKAPNLLTKCKRLLKQLAADPNGHWFLHPVDYVTYGLSDYPQIIKEPMDFSTIEARLKDNVYKTHHEFAEDVRLTFQNAITYNRVETHPCHMSATQLLETFDLKFAALEGTPKPKASKPKTPGKEPPKNRTMGSATPKVAKVSIVEPPKPSWRVDALQLIKYTASAEKAAWFKEPLPLDFPGYYTTITHPMDLKTLRSNLQSGVYPSMDEFLVDARRIFINARTFNRPGEACYLAAEDVWIQFETKLTNLTGLPVCEEVKAIKAAKEKESKEKASDSAKAPRRATMLKVERPLTQAEKVKLSEDINELDDDQMEEAMNIIEAALNIYGAEDAEVELDIDQVPTKTQRKLQKLVKAFLNPGLEPEAKESPPTDSVSSAQAAPSEVPPQEQIVPNTVEDEKPSHRPSHGKSLNAPPVKVSTESVKPDSAKTDSENSPSQTPEVEARESPKDAAFGSVPAPVVRDREGLPPKPPLRRPSPLDGDVTSSSDDDSDVESSDKSRPIARKRQREELAPSSADGAASSAGCAFGGDDRKIEGAAMAPGEPAPLVRGQSHDAWLLSAKTMDDAEEPSTKKARTSSMDDVEKDAWRMAQEKSEDLLLREKRKRIESESQRRLQEEEQERQRKILQEKERQRAEEARLKEEQRAEQARAQEEAERERLRKIAEQQTRQTVDLDADANLVSEYL